MGEYTHFDCDGHPVLVDVSDKAVTKRTAVAEGWVYLPDEIFKTVSGGPVKKGDPLAVAELGGIMGAKRTPDLIPLCHSIRLDNIKVKCSLDHEKKAVKIICEASASEVTGVEMEALTGVSAAALTFYDMCKGIDKGMVLKDIRLLSKTGGKSGDWKCEQKNADVAVQIQNASDDRKPIRTAVLTISDKGSKGERIDTAGPELERLALALGCVTELKKIVPDDKKAICDTVKEWADCGIELILTTGGTGISPRDNTPEALLSIADRVVPGFGEVMRIGTLKYTPRAFLTRSVAVTVGNALVIAFPGSKRACTQCFGAIEEALRHAVETLTGQATECGNHNKKL